MTHPRLILKVPVLAICGLFLIGFLPPKESIAGLRISNESVPIFEAKRAIEGSELFPVMKPLDAAPGPERFSAQLEKPDSLQKTTEPSEQAQTIVPLEVSREPAVPSTQPGLSVRGYTSRYFHIDRPKVGLGLSYEFEEEQTKASGSTTTETSQEFRERLILETSGWVYHPAFCKYTLGFVPEWSQTKRSSDSGNSGTDSVFAPAYAVDAFFLEPKPYTLHAFANRREYKLRSAFSEPTDSTIDTYGGDLRLKYYKTLPAFFKYTHTDTDQSGFYESRGERDDLQLSSQYITENSTTTLNSVYSDDERTSGGESVRVKTSDNNLGNEFYFAGDQRRSLLSRLRYRWTDTDSQITREYGLEENLFWRFTDNLFTSYIFSYQNRDTESFDSEITAFRARLQHLLYENLTTDISAGFNLNDFSGGEENTYDGSLDFLYNRRIPWGTLTLRSGWDYIYSTREGEEGPVTVTDEPHVLITGEITLLNNEDVDPDSIIVTDVTGTIAYIENVDYTIEPFDSFTRISRTTVGAIANGQTVLVDYRFFRDPAFDDTSLNQRYGIQFYLWNALTLAYGFQKSDQDITSGTSPGNPRDDTTHRAEIRYNLGWTDTRLNFEDRDRSSGVSTRTWVASQTFRVRPRRSRLVFDVTGSYGRTKFTDLGDEQERYGGSPRLIWMPTGWCRFRMEGFLTKITGDVEDRLDANFFTGFELSYRIWRGKAGYYYDRSGSSDAYRNRHSLKFEIIRILW